MYNQNELSRVAAVKLTKQNEEMLEQIREKLGITYVSEVIRYCISRTYNEMREENGLLQNKEDGSE